MEEEVGGSKLKSLSQITKLKEMFQKWQTSPSLPLAPKDMKHSGISPIINKRLTNLVYCDSDEESCYSPHDVPKGYLAVYVGPEHRRFTIPTTYLSHSLFKLLLEKAAEEFGFDHSGGITIPCEIEIFKYLLNCMQNNHQDHHHHDTPENTGSIEE